MPTSIHSSNYRADISNAHTDNSSCTHHPEDVSIILRKIRTRGGNCTVSFELLIITAFRILWKLIQVVSLSFEIFKINNPSRGFFTVLTSESLVHPMPTESGGNC